MTTLVASLVSGLTLLPLAVPIIGLAVFLLVDSLREPPLRTPGGRYALYADSECGDVSCQCRLCGEVLTVQVADVEEALGRLAEWDRIHECEAA